VKQNGYDVVHGGRVITVFSAPNYCDYTGNKGAFMKLSGKELKYKFVQFDAVVRWYIFIGSSKNSSEEI
jgi:serine/threonine-protein phosphatase 5